jgi:hypothetical protein
MSFNSQIFLTLHEQISKYCRSSCVQIPILHTSYNGRYMIHTPPLLLSRVRLHCIVLDTQSGVMCDRDMKHN